MFGFNRALEGTMDYDMKQEVLRALKQCVNISMNIKKLLQFVSMLQSITLCSIIILKHCLNFRRRGFKHR